MSRFLVLEQHPAAAVADAAAELSSGSARTVDGWHKPIPGVELVCVGAVRSPQDAAAAVLCAMSGARLVIDAAGPRDVVDRLCDDLRRLGDLDHRVGPPTAITLPGDERALLALLLGGATLGQAARELHISRRTADRRLAAARARLSAHTTSEAVAAAGRLGVQPVRPGDDSTG